MNSPIPITHPRTHEQLEQFMHRPAHAALLAGQDGIGKGYMAQGLAATLLGFKAEMVTGHPHVRVISPDEKRSISIEAIRQLQHFLQLKTIGTQSIRRIAIVEHADRLTTEAQNAFLKLLEEPPLDTVLLLTATTPRALLPTIVSRLQVISIYVPAIDDLRRHFLTSGIESSEFEKAYALSGGLPGLMHALLQEDQEHPLVQGVAIAKDLLSLPVADRLSKIDTLSKQKQIVGQTVEAMLRIARTGIDKATQNGDTKKLKRWHHILKEASEAQTALSVSANAKLVLTNLMLQL